MTSVLIFEILALAASGLALFYVSYQLLATFLAAPYVKSDSNVIKCMIKNADLTEGTQVLELGSGDGEICLQAATHGAKAVGFELNPVLVWWARYRAWRRGLNGRVTFKRANFWKTPFPPNTHVVFLYLLPRAMSRLWSKMARELRPGTLIISHAFPIKDREPIAKNENVFIYKLES